MKTCCEHHGIDCCQGRECPLREPCNWAVIGNVLFVGLYLSGLLLVAVFLAGWALISYTL